MSTYFKQKVPEVFMRQDGRLVGGVCEGNAGPSYKKKKKEEASRLFSDEAQQSLWKITDAVHFTVYL